MKPIIFCLLLILTAGILIAGDLDKAITDGDLLKVKSILKENPSLLNEKNDQTLTPLSKALVEGKKEIALELINLGADLTIGDKDNSFPIHYAAWMGDPELFELIRAKSKMSIETQDNEGATPIFYTIMNKKPEMFKYLADKGANLKAVTKDNYPLLLYTAIYGQVEPARLLIEKKVDLNAKSKRGIAPLHSAVSYGRTEIVKLLIENGADINPVTEEGETPIFWASRPTTCDAVTYLIEKGADLKHRNESGTTPLMALCHSGNLKNIQLLVEKGADINEVDNYGSNALSYAIWSVNPVDLLKFLILHGAEVNPACTNKETGCRQGVASPLCRASFTGNIEAMDLLISNGAKVNVRDQQGITPLTYAIKKGNPDGVRLLLDHGAFIDQPDPDLGYTELMLASVLGEDRIVSMLLEKGANPALKNKDGKNALDLAWQYGHKGTAYLLLSKGANDENLKDLVRTTSQFDQPVEEGKAAVWFLGHSGWAVKTKNNFLIFDYNVTGGNKYISDSSLVSGFIVPQELKGQKVTVFSSHSHADHYGKNIFRWKKQLPDLTYVLCFVPNDTTCEYTYMPVHSEKTINGMKVSTVKSTDLDGGFLVEVDGLVIFHPGDLANGEDNLMKAYKDEIDMVASKGLKIDLAFAPIRGCSLGRPPQVKIGVEYLCEKLKPNLLIPMHFSANTPEYRKFAAELSKTFPSQKVTAVVNRGDNFVYTH